MGMMARMRSLASWFIILVGGLFVLFMVLSDSRITEFVGQRSNNVGYINGEEVTYQEFAQFVERARANQVEQTGQDIDESQMDQFRDQVWDALVTQKLIEEKVDEFGIKVTDQEIVDAVLGANPPEYLKQGFIDSTGQFNRQMYEQAILDPQNKEILLQVEEGIRQQKVQEKLQSYLTASVLVSEEEIKRDFIEQNIKMDAEYLLVDVNTIPDTAVEVTDSDLQKFYEENLEDYKIEPQRKVKYVLFKREPSKGDSLGIKNNLEAIVENLEEDTSTFKTFVEIYSDQPYSKDTVSISQLPSQAVSALDNADEGSIVGPLLTFEGYVVYKLDDKIRTDETFVNASHILVAFGKEGEEAAKEKADQLYQQLMNGADFALLATKESDDPGSARKGGNLGWFGRGQMVQEFEDASFSGPIGKIQRPIKTTYGYHIIKVEDRTNQKFVIEKIVNKIVPSATTIDNIYNQASDFAYLADKNGFESEAELLGYKVIETPPFAEDAQTIPGIGYSKAVIQFAFNNSVGDISDVFKVPTGYTVVMVSENIKAGFKPLEEVEASIRSKVLREKKKAKAKEIVLEIRNNMTDDDLRKAAELHPKARFGNATSFSTTGTITGLGKEFAITEYAVDAPLNQISDPIVGRRGAYLVKVTRRNEFDQAAYEQQRATIRDNLLQIKRANFFGRWVEELKESAEIEDRRYMFYR